MTADPLEFAGILVGCVATATAIVVDDSRLRSIAMLVALVTAPILIAGSVWNEPRIVDFRDSPAQLALGAVAGLLLLVGAVAAFERWPQAFPIAAVTMLPLRVPLEVGGETANLLVPLYLVIAAGAVVAARHSPPAIRLSPVDIRSAPGALRWLLAATLLLYGIQASYSRDVSNAVENLGFFLIPFAVLFVLLAAREWTPRLIGRVLIAIGAIATACASVALFQSATRDLFLNPELFDANQLHQYFRVNSVFFDPNIFGRYMALAITALGAYITTVPSAKGWRAAGLALLAAGICLLALAFSYSITSMAALIGGLGIVAILRWSWRGLIGAGALGLAGLIALVIAGGTPTSDIQTDRVFDSGHTPLVEGGVDLFQARPFAGHGSGGFGRAFYEDIEKARTTVSHSEPITVAAEQGVIGVIPYVALLAVALVTMLGAGAGSSVARTAVAACFVAMLVHSLGYAGFLTDPATWALLALGVSLRSTINNVPPASSASPPGAAGSAGGTAKM